MRPESILVVDDEPTTLLSMRAFLQGQGYRALTASSGEEALLLCAQERPDLIMLDINMPGMNGIEVCRRLKSDPALASIPVLFVSALVETEYRIQAFQAGGVDYLTKPFHLKEVEARVKVHMELLRQRRELLAGQEALRRLEDLRDSFTHMIAHDMRSSLTAIGTSIELALESPERIPPRRPLERALRVSRNLAGMVTQMLDVSRLESGQMPLNLQVCGLEHLVRAALETLPPLPAHQRIEFTPPASLWAQCDPELTTRVLANLLGNALKFIPNPGLVRIQFEMAETEVWIAISDNGPGISQEEQELIFDKFGQAMGGRKQGGSGLGLAFCKLAVEAQHGRIGVASAPGKGSTFWFTLPAAQPGTPAAESRQGGSIQCLRN
jgi:signal transduction histidine kinase